MTRSRKLFLCIIVLGLIILIVVQQILHRGLVVLTLPSSIFALFEDSVKVTIKDLKDIEQSKWNIFFIETSCGTLKSSQQFVNSPWTLGARQSCSVESAARTNPSRPVYLLHTCPLDLPAHARPLRALPNVFLVPLRMSEVLQDSPLRGLYRSGRLEDSIYPVAHASDLLRLVVLWRFGGTYSDLDVIVLKPLDRLGSNFCGLQDSYSIANGVLNFEPSGYGHEILTKVLREVNTEFNGQLWSANGPILITKTMLKECNMTITNLSKCKVFTVYNNTVLYPIHWTKHQLLFNASEGPAVVEFIKHSGSYMAHFWNKLSSRDVVSVDSNQAYALLADEFCPGTCKSLETTVF